MEGGAGRASLSAHVREPRRRKRTAVQRNGIQSGAYDVRVLLMPV